MIPDLKRLGECLQQGNTFTKHLRQSEFGTELKNTEGLPRKTLQHAFRDILAELRVSSTSSGQRR